MKALDGLREAVAVLNEYGIKDSCKEAEIIFTGCMEMSKVALYRDNPTLSYSQQEEIRKILARRGRREPLQYIVGHVDFCGLRIHVGPGVLIPRPETEFIVEEVRKIVNRDASGARGERRPSPAAPDAPLHILDLCTGSGCLALALAKEFPTAQVFATEVSAKALEYATMNAYVNGVQNVTLLKGDLYEPVAGRMFDIIVSNPPYVRREEIDTLQPEIRGWEPLEALDGGKDGLRFYREIFARAREHLVRGGSLVVELGLGGFADALPIAEQSGLRCTTLVRDYLGIERILGLSPR